MKADRVEVSRDDQRNSWLIRIKVGGEVIRRYCDEPKDADKMTLRSAALKATADVGFTVDPTSIVIGSIDKTLFAG